MHHDHKPAGSATVGHHLHWRGEIRTRRAVISTSLARGGLIVSLNFGGLLGNPDSYQSMTSRVIAGISVGVFLVGTLIAVRGATDDLVKLLTGRLRDNRSAALRVICLLSGYALVILGTLSLVRVPWEKLLVGGALTGVILDIAAQPVLGNIFAGLVLLVAHPFTIGEKISVQSGPLGGRIEGEVTDMPLLFIELHSDYGKMLLPNNAVLGAAIGPPARETATARQTPEAL
ncbi:Mechanosensitive ion channel (plasmid) [Streptomyces sp. YIM 121038]|uniref:mechanosensitive ion channel domain-containing protein n=1 Tax=Streptomyces sp. YIM 121038 TaxID=2136401 RepID=UPI001110F790|nr:mechanosensitive ion channel family protein [Streptomyces sp. YIM 121038]QCX82702.1 Mechanosensitive ion channel [Streptomyces sp. YIM 121038]